MTYTCPKCHIGIMHCRGWAQMNSAWPDVNKPCNIWYRCVRCHYLCKESRVIGQRLPEGF